LNRFGYKPWWGSGPRPTTAEGKRVCKMCPNAIAGGRREYCSEACSDDYNTRVSGSYARLCVKRRDDEVCSECGTDTKALRAAFRTAEAADKIVARCIARKTRRLARINKAWPKCRHVTLQLASRFCVWCHACTVCHPHDPRIHAPLTWATGVQEWRAMMIDLGYRRALAFAFSGTQHLWEADHWPPVAEGGGGAPLSGLRTLCLPCHGKATAELAARLATKRREKRNAATEV